MGEMRNTYRALVGKPEGKKPLERPRPMWEDNIKNKPYKNRMGVWIGFGIQSSGGLL
jgi:hypothetical protein